MKKIFLILTLFISLVSLGQQYKNYGDDHKHFINSKLDSINSGTGTTVVYGSATGATTPVLKVNNSSSGIGVLGISSSNYGVKASSTSGVGLYAEGSSGAATFTLNSGGTSSVSDIILNYGLTSGTAANGFGVQYQTLLATNGFATGREAVTPIIDWLNATDASRSARYRIRGVKTASASDWFKLDGDFGYLASDTIATRAYARSVGGGGGGGPVALSSLTAMGGSNTIDNLDYPNTWNWNSLATTGTGNAFTLGSSSTATISNSILKINRTGASTGAINTIGLDIVNSATGASATNMGLRISSSGASINYGLIVAAGQVGIGNQTPAASSIVDIASTTQGFLAPRMTQTQRDAIGSPATGLLIYQTDNSPGFYYYSGSAWGAVGGGGGGMTDPGANGIVVRTALNTTAARSITGVTNKISISQGDGVAGNPSINIGTDVVDKTAATTYTAGAKQTFASDGTSAAFSDAGVTADPSVLSDGDMWYRTDLDVMKYRQNGSSRIIANTDGTQTFNNKFVTPRLNSNASSSTPTPVASTDDMYTLTALAVGATFAAPGAGVDGQTLLIRIKDNGTARSLAWNSGTNGYRASTDLPLPTITTLSKTMYLKFVYNSADQKWDFVSFLDNFSLLDGFIFSVILGGLATGVERRIRRRKIAA